MWTGLVSRARHIKYDILIYSKKNSRLCLNKFHTQFVSFHHEAKLIYDLICTLRSHMIWQQRYSSFLFHFNLTLSFTCSSHLKMAAGWRTRRWSQFGKAKGRSISPCSSLQWPQKFSTSRLLLRLNSRISLLRKLWYLMRAMGIRKELTMSCYSTHGRHWCRAGFRKQDLFRSAEGAEPDISEYCIKTYVGWH
jgi:hypothetical protein